MAPDTCRLPVMRRAHVQQHSLGEEQAPTRRRQPPRRAAATVRRDAAHAMTEPTTVAALRTQALADRDALREHLDTLNEAGTTPVSVGVDAAAQPFLITLVGRRRKRRRAPNSYRSGVTSTNSANDECYGD